MGLTKRRDSYYVAFSVIDSPDGLSLVLASGVRGARVKRWKVGCLNKTVAKEMEAVIRTNLMLGKVSTEKAKPVLFKDWAKTYLDLESVRALRTYQDRIEIMERQLIPFFGSKIMTEIRPADIEQYRGQRLKRNGMPARLQTINNDHVVLKHCLNVAVRRGLLVGNPASRVPMPNPQNERDRVLSAEEWDSLYGVAKPHLKPVLLLAYQLGQRLSEIVGLTWDRVDLKREFIALRSIDTKTKKPRQVPMTPFVKDTLNGYGRSAALQRGASSCIKVNRCGTSARHLERRWKKRGLAGFGFMTCDTVPRQTCGELGSIPRPQCRLWGTRLRRCGNATTTSTRQTLHKRRKHWGSISNLTL